MQFLALGTVGVNGDGDLGCLAQLVETVETVRVGVGAEGPDAQFLAEVEQPLVRVLVLGEVLYAKGDRLYLVIGAQPQQRLDLCRRAAGGSVLVVELDEVEAEVADALQRLLGVELTEAVALGADGEVAKGIGGVLQGVGLEDIGQSGQAEGGVAWRKLRREQKAGCCTDTGDVSLGGGLLGEYY